MPDVEVSEEVWESEMRERIHRFFCTVHHRSGVTQAKAQEIFGEFSDADEILAWLDDKGLVFRSPVSDKWEFTAKGLEEYFRQHLKTAKEKLGHDPDEVEFMRFMLNLSAEGSA